MALVRRLLTPGVMTLTTLAVTMLLSATAAGDLLGPSAPTQEQERAEARRRYVERVHTELSFGYLGEWRSDAARSWELSSQGVAPGAAAMTAPFNGKPFDGVVASGMTLESRVVYDRVRFSVGFRLPFASFRQADTTSTVDFGGTSHEVMVRSLSMLGFRTGLGVELPFGLVTPYLDLLGDVEKVSASLVVDGDRTEWSAAGFSLGVRTGVRVQVSQVFVMLGAEATALGAPRFGGTVQAGFAF